MEGAISCFPCPSCLRDSIRRADFDNPKEKRMHDDLVALKARLEQQLAEFERKYSLDSEEFYERFERGELGDAMDFVEWSATYAMVENLKRQLSVLGWKETNPSGHFRKDMVK